MLPFIVESFGSHRIHGRLAERFNTRQEADQYAAATAKAYRSDGYIVTRIGRNYRMGGRDFSGNLPPYEGFRVSEMAMSKSPYNFGTYDLKIPRIGLL